MVYANQFRALCRKYQICNLEVMRRFSGAMRSYSIIKNCTGKHTKPTQRKILSGILRAEIYVTYDLQNKQIMMARTSTCFGSSIH